MTPTEVTHEWFEEVWNKLDESAIDRLLAEPCEIIGLAETTICDREAMRGFFKQMTGALEGIHITVGQTVESGNTVAVFFNVTATHRVTGNPFVQKNACIAVVENGQIVSADNVIDFLSLFIQTGILPADAIQQGLSSNQVV